MRRRIVLLAAVALAGAALLVMREMRRTAGARGEPPGAMAARAAGPAADAGLSPDAVGVSRGGVIAGIVTRGGAPCAAAVELRRLGARLPPEREADWLSGRIGGGEALQAGRAGPDGRFEIAGLDRGVYEVLAESGGARGRIEVEIPRDSAHVEERIALPGGSLALSGRAVTGDGRPFAGTIWLDRADAEDRFRAPADRLASPVDPEGRFGFGGLEPGRVTLQAFEPGRLWVASPAIALPRDGEYLFDVDAGTTVLAGRVVAALTGRPVAGAAVTAASGGADWAYACRRAETDAGGLFRIPVLPGLVRIDARAPGFGPEERDIPGGTRGVEIALFPAAAVSGTVRSAEDRRPVAGVPVHLQPCGRYGDEDQAFAVSDAAGRFSVAELPPGEYRVLAWGAEWVPAPLADRGADGLGDLVVHVGPGEARAVELLVRPATAVEGRVLDAAGAPAGGVDVRVHAVSNWACSAPPDLFETTSDGEGRFRVDGLVPGWAYELRGVTVDRGRAESGPWTAVTGAAMVVELRLPAPRYMTVRVVERDTLAPLAGARVEAGARGEIGFSDVAESFTDAAGVARLGPLPLGSLGVRVEHPECFPSEWEPVPAPEDGESELSAEIELGRGFPIPGAARFTDGTPVPRGTVKCRECVPVEIVDGEFRIWILSERPPPGSPWKLDLEGEAWRDGRRFSASAEVEVGESGVLLAFEEREAEASRWVVLARVTDPEGRPVPSARATLHSGSAITIDGPARYSTRGEVLLYPGSTRRLGHISVEISDARSVDGARLGGALTAVFDPGDGPCGISLPPESLVGGTVRRADGSPVAGVRVVAEHCYAEPASWDEFRWDAGPPHGESLTDGDGRFLAGGLGDGEYTVRALPGPDNTASMPVRVRGGDEGVSIVVGTAVSATITVLDWQDRPVGGAEVRAEAVADPAGAGPPPLAARAPMARSATDADGRARLTGLEDGREYSLHVEAPAGRRDLAPMTETDWRPGDLILHLGRLYGIRGFVRDADGRPVGGATVHIFGATWFYRFVETDPRGAFAFMDLGKGLYQVWVEVGAACAAETGTDDLSVEAGTEDLVIALPRFRDLLVRVVGCPAGEHYVSLRPRGTARDRSAPIGADGTAPFKGVSPDTIYHLWVAPTDSGLCVYVPAVRGDAVEVVVRLAPGKSITGRLTLSEALPDEWTEPAVRVYGPGFSVDGEVREDLTYEVRGIPEGEWEVCAWAGSQSGTARARAGETADITLTPEGD